MREQFSFDDCAVQLDVLSVVIMSMPASLSGFATIIGLSPALKLRGARLLFTLISALQGQGVI